MSSLYPFASKSVRNFLKFPSIPQEIKTSRNLKIYCIINMGIIEIIGLYTTSFYNTRYKTVYSFENAEEVVKKPRSKGKE